MAGHRSCVKAKRLRDGSGQDLRAEELDNQGHVSSQN